jgi:hypothetical protein
LDLAEYDRRARVADIDNGETVAARGDVGEGLAAIRAGGGEGYGIGFALKAR